MSIVIVGAQTSAARRTFLLGSVCARKPSARANIRIVHLE
jgi:hypothetical protein